MIESDRFIPLSAIDENDTVIGHLFIRYPNETDDSIVRFGYVIVNPALRGCGEGKEMLKLAIGYARNVLNESKITLGFFSNSNSTRYGYEAVGFRSAERKFNLYKEDDVYETLWYTEIRNRKIDFKKICK